MVAPVRAAKRRRSAEERVRSVVNLLVGAALALLEHRARRVSPKSDSIPALLSAIQFPRFR